MPGKFVVKKGSTGKFRFSLLSTNGQVVASSEAYNSKASCMKGIKAVQSLAGGAEVEDQTTRQWAKAEEARKSAAKKATARKATARKATARRTTAKKAAKTAS